MSAPSQYVAEKVEVVEGESSQSGVLILDAVFVCLSHHLHLISLGRKRHRGSPHGLIVGAAPKPPQTFSSPRDSLVCFPMLTTYARGSMHPSMWLPNSHAVAPRVVGFYRFSAPARCIDRSRWGDVVRNTADMTFGRSSKLLRFAWLAWSCACRFTAHATAWIKGLRPAMWYHEAFPVTHCSFDVWRDFWLRLYRDVKISHSRDAFIS